MLAGVAGYGLLRTVKKGRSDRRYLDENEGETQFELGHLPSALRRFTWETHALRISLEGPARRLRETDPGLFGGADGWTEGADRAEISRGVSEWILLVQGLSPSERGLLEDRGIELARAIAIAAPLAALEADYKTNTLRARLDELGAELKGLEVSLTQTPENPYR